MYPDPGAAGEDAQKKAQGLTMERVAFSFMKQRIQPLMQWEHVGFEYTRADDGSRLSAKEISDYLMMERLQKIFKNLHGIPTVVPEFNASSPPHLVSLQAFSPRVLLSKSSRVTNLLPCAL